MTERYNALAVGHARHCGAVIFRACCLGALAAQLLLGNGCARRYAMTLANSDVVYTNGKPRLNERGWYVFRDIQGREQQINALRVRSIEVK